MDKMNKCLVIGSGLTGSTCAYILAKNGWDVEVHDKDYRVGGHVKTASINGLLYEENAIHVNHTDNDNVINLINEVSEWIKYNHIVKTEVDGRLFLWPPHINELKDSGDWIQISQELDSLPEFPNQENFEEYAISIMGKTLYNKFIYPYTLKQWGTEPKNLSAAFAPKRIDLRKDGHEGMFYEKWQAFPSGGWTKFIDLLLTTYPVNIWLGKEHTEKTVDWDSYDVVVITAALDDFMERDQLNWRGVRVEHNYIPKYEGLYLPAAQINHPGLDKEYTRRTETKWKSGQQDLSGTVVTYEFPGSKEKHYPVYDAEGKNRAYANSLKSELKSMHKNAIIAGRLANYIYINTDQAIMQGINAAREAMSQ